MRIMENRNEIRVECESMAWEYHNMAVMLLVKCSGWNVKVWVFAINNKRIGASF
jgi:hypothetical protein